MNNNNKRNVNIDIIRGFAVYCVVLGHFLQYIWRSDIDVLINPLFIFIYSFHMPLFMLVSGYLFFYSISHSIKEIVVSKFVKICIPTLVFMAASWCVRGLIKEEVALTAASLVNEFWFISVLIEIMIFVTISEKLIGNNKFLKLICLMAGAFIMFLQVNRDYVLFLYPYFLIGLYFNKYKDVINPKYYYNKMLIVVVTMIYVTMLMFFNKDYYIYATGIFNRFDIVRSLQIDLYRYAVGLLGCVCVVLVIVNINKRVDKNSFLSKKLEKCGVNSLYIYLLQHILLELLGKSFVSRTGVSGLLIKNNLTVVFNYIIPIVSAFFILLMMNWIYERIHCSILSIKGYRED